MTSFLSGLIHLGPWPVAQGPWDVWRSGATGDRGGGKICPPPQPHDGCCG